MWSNSEKICLPKVVSFQGRGYRVSCIGHQESTISERFDVQSYEHQLLSTLADCSSLVEKHNRDIVSHFLSLIGNDTTTPNKLPKTKLIAWLTLFSKFSNPKALYATESLRSVYFTLLSHPDRSLQSISLSCLLAYKVSFPGSVRGTDPSVARRHEVARGAHPPRHRRYSPSARSDAVDVIIRVLFGVMLERRGHGRGGGAERRSAVLSALAACTDKELGLLIDLMLKPIGWDRTSAQEITTEGVFHVTIGRDRAVRCFRKTTCRLPNAS
jgi:U3 small nucleolar RNA-associated protein 20